MTKFKLVSPVELLAQESALASMLYEKGGRGGIVCWTQPSDGGANPARLVGIIAALSDAPQLSYS